VCEGVGGGGVGEGWGLRSGARIVSVGVLAWWGVSVWGVTSGGGWVGGVGWSVGGAGSVGGVVEGGGGGGVGGWLDLGWWFGVWVYGGGVGVGGWAVGWGPAAMSGAVVQRVREPRGRPRRAFATASADGGRATKTAA